MKTPYFSIVIPTCERPKFLNNAVNSVLNQEFQDFEVIIVDATRKKSKVDYKSFKSVKYIHNPKLGMIFNWNSGLSEAKGEYVIFLTDRSFFSTKNVLQQLYKITKSTGEQVVSYKNARLDESKLSISPSKLTSKTEFKTIERSSLIDWFLEGRFEQFRRYAPKLLNSCISRKVINQCLENGLDFIQGVSPDFTACFNTLCFVDKILHINEDFFSTYGNQLSTGFRARLDYQVIIKYAAEHALPVNTLYDHVPVKVISSHNILVNDFFRVFPENECLKEASLNMEEYFLRVYEDIHNMYVYNGYNQFDKWYDALNNFQDTALQQRIDKQIEKLERDKFYREGKVFNVLETIKSYNRYAYFSLKKYEKKMALAVHDLIENNIE